MLKAIPYIIIGFILALACVSGVEQATSSSSQADLDLEQGEIKTINIFQKASQSVVFITSKKRVRMGFSFFGGYMQDQVQQGSGSGVIWDQEGHIVTNYHVIVGADSLVVTLPDNSEWEGQIVGQAPDSDLAVLKIEAPKSKLKPLTIGDSSNLLVGQKVLAIGNPFGLDQTLTTGVVSALKRQIKSITGSIIRDAIQTDAAINPGNSGGPLLDSKGRLIGVNAAIISPSGSSAGIGFAVPVNTVARIIPQLIKNIRAGLGVKLLSDSWARKNSIEGVIIQEVEPNSSAKRAGLQGLKSDGRGYYYLGDVITGIDDKVVTNGEELFNVLQGYKVNDEIKVHLLRNGEDQITVTLKLQAIPAR